MELRRDAPLFDKLLPIEVSDDRDDPHYVSLVFRIIKGFRNTTVPGQTEVLYHFEVSDNRDSYFLYHLDVGEQDYPAFKREHAIRVEFHSMPTKVIELLEHCIASSTAATTGDTATSVLNEDISIYTAKLNVSTGVFSIILSNHFNNVLTLNLQMNEGDDAAIKSYLAARMNLSLDICRRQGMEIALLRAKCEENEQAIEELKSAAHELRTQRNVDLQSLRAEHSQEISQLQRSALESAEESRQKFEEQILALKRQLEETQKQLHTRTMSSQQQIADLEHDRSQLDFKNRDLQRVLQGVESDRDRLLKETEDLHSTRRLLEEERAVTLRDMTRLESKVEALQQQLKDRDESMLKSQQLQKASEEAKLTAEERTKLFAQRAEECMTMLNQRSDELQAANNRIERLTSELSNFKKSMSDKNEVIRQQEALIQEQRKKSAELERQYNKSDEDLRRLQETHERLKRDMSDCKAKLEDSQQAIEQNQVLITYLNNELSRNQLGDRPLAEPAFVAANPTSSSSVPRTPSMYGPTAAGATMKTPDTAVGRFMPFSSSVPAAASARAGGMKANHRPSTTTYTSPYTPSYASSTSAAAAAPTTTSVKGRNLLQEPASQTEDQLLFAKGIQALGLADALQEDLGLNLQQMTALAATSTASSLSFGESNRLWKSMKEGNKLDLEEMDYYATINPTTAAATGGGNGNKVGGKTMAKVGGER